MTSKWLDDIMYVVDESELKEIMPTLERIDKLLRKAMLSTDDENFSDQIRKEIDGE